MRQTSRKNQIAKLFESEPAFRLRQIETAIFQPEIHSWQDISTLPKIMRQKLEEFIAFSTLKVVHIFESEDKNTFKAIVETIDERQIETVLMKNSRDYWTVCVSAQIGCAMACSFCSTGKMGLTRNLIDDEIVDQLRMWRSFLDERPKMEQLISNIVYMGMGEPLANYENVKTSINTILEHTEIGNTKITVSTVGVLPRLEQILTDEEWPHVKIAISLHSADIVTRKQIVPSSYANFLPKLAHWAKQYREKHGNRRHYLTFEYVMLKNINDSILDAKQLAKYIRKIGNVKVNLIPYNAASGDFSSSDQQTMDQFKDILENRDINVTIRNSKGDDIAAACGQLANQK